MPAEERIAVFDNDGTLWSEQPMVVQLAFALDRARALGVPVDRADRMARGHAALLDLLTRTHTGMDTEAFAALVRRFAAFGNFDADLAMLRWVTSGPGLRLGMLVHHDTTTPRRRPA